MKLLDAVQYISNKALDAGYTQKQIDMFTWEVTELVNQIEDCSVEELDKLFEELF